MKVKPWLTALSLVVLSLSTAHAEQYDLVIAGAGTGGSSAAIQAARMGLKVALIEETGWIGGQMTAAGVGTLDDLRRNRSGLYGEFVTALRAHYKALGVNSGICYWGADTVSGTARDQQNLLRSMFKDAGDVDIFLNSTVTSLIEKNGSVVGVNVETPQGPRHFDAKVTIDATELGDLLPLTSARYRLGNSISPYINKSTSIQDITWVAAIHKRADGVPTELESQAPKHYHDQKKFYRAIVTSDGNVWPKGYPYNVPTFKAYRAYPDVDWNLKILGDNPKTWDNVTSTSLNWGNDYPGRGEKAPGLPAKYITDLSYRKKVNEAALRRTLGLLHYFRTELKQSDWTVDTRQGFADSGDDPSRLVTAMPQWALDLARHMPPIPYVREARRLVGVQTLTAKDIHREGRLLPARKRFADAIAVGEYPVDVHGSTRDSYLEKDLNETAEDFPKKWHAGTFQVPLGCLIPEKLDGFLAAEKNLSVSRLVNGATRLHPITMLTGQAAGALAALSVRYNLPPREIPVALVQQELLEARSLLSLGFFDDVAMTNDFWPAAQFVSIEALPTVGKTTFGDNFPVLRRHMNKVLLHLLNFREKELLQGHSDDVMTAGDFIRTVKQHFATTDWLTSLPTDETATLTRGDMARVVYLLAKELALREIQSSREKKSVS